MAEKRKIPCRVCGRLFEPCAYCKSHADIFRWRNFACSKECAAEYIAEATAYRESLHNPGKDAVKGSTPQDGKPAAARKKTDKKLQENTESKKEEKETG